MAPQSTVTKSQPRLVFRRILFEIAIPVVCGVAWGALALHQRKTLFEAFSTGFAAFFFTFFLQGQVLRMNKNVRDELNADEVRDNFISIHEGLRELRAKKQAEEAAAATTNKETKRLPEEFADKGGVDIDAYDGDVLFAKPFFVEADRAFRQGALYPAMLSAAVGFEHALREVGSRYLDLGKSKPLGLVLHELGKRDTSQHIVPTARTLLQLRNGLVHGDNYDPDTPPFEAVQVIWAFMRSVSAIQEMVAGWPALHFDKAVQERERAEDHIDKKSASAASNP
jgi:hypothetical protein